jgi:hypothetical protein
VVVGADGNGRGEFIPARKFSRADVGGRSFAASADINPQAAGSVPPLCRDLRVDFT